MDVSDQLYQLEAKMENAVSKYRALLIIAVCLAISGWLVAFNLLGRWSNCRAYAPAPEYGCDCILVVPPYVVPEGCGSEPGVMLDLYDPSGGVYILGEPYATIPGGGLPGPQGMDNE